VNWTPILPGSDKKDFRVGKGLVYVFAALSLPVILACRLVYKIVFSWWLTSILAQRQQEKFIHKIRSRLAFLFEEHAAEVVPNEPTRDIPGRYFSLATLKVENLRLRILEKNSRLAVHVAPDFAPSDWYELEAVLSAVENDVNVGRKSYTGFYDLERLLRQNLQVIASAFLMENHEKHKKLIGNIDIREKRFQNSYVDKLFGKSEPSR
jgi:hypothetical protein